MDWRIGPSGQEVRSDDRRPPRRRSRDLKRTFLYPLLAALYAVALVFAGWVGFATGRWADARTGFREAIESQLELEGLAWREGDLDLFASTVDPGAPPWWREEIVTEFSVDAPQSVEIRPVRLERLSPDRVLVLVEMTAPGGTRTESRTYVLKQNTWYRTVGGDRLGEPNR
jgi:hypothetical protein